MFAKLFSILLVITLCSSVALATPIKVKASLAQPISNVSLKPAGAAGDVSFKLQHKTEKAKHAGENIQGGTRQQPVDKFEKGQVVSVRTSNFKNAKKPVSLLHPAIILDNEPDETGHVRVAYMSHNPPDSPAKPAQTYGLPANPKRMMESQVYVGIPHMVHRNYLYPNTMKLLEGHSHVVKDEHWNKLKGDINHNIQTEGHDNLITRDFVDLDDYWYA